MLLLGLVLIVLVLAITIAYNCYQLYVETKKLIRYTSLSSKVIEGKASFIEPLTFRNSQFIRRYEGITISDAPPEKTFFHVSEGEVRIVH